MAPVAYTSSDENEKSARLGDVYDVAANLSARAPEAQVALDNLTRRVREQSDKIQKTLTPYADALKEFAEARPVGFTWLAIFAGLSLVPVLCFVGFVLTASAFIIGTALVIVSSCVIGVVLLSSAVLVPVLVLTGFLATSAVVLLLGLFLAHRLFLHIRAATVTQSLSVASVSQGVRTWAEETSARVGLGSSDFQPLASDAKDHTEDRKAEVDVKFSPFASSKEAKPPGGLRQRTSSERFEGARAPTPKAASPRMAHMKHEPQDIFSPPQPGHHSLASTESRDSEWTSTSDVEFK